MPCPALPCCRAEGGEGEGEGAPEGGKSKRVKDRKDRKAKGGATLGRAQSTLASMEQAVLLPNALLRQHVMGYATTPAPPAAEAAAGSKASGKPAIAPPPGLPPPPPAVAASPTTATTPGGAGAGESASFKAVVAAAGINRPAAGKSPGKQQDAGAPETPAPRVQVGCREHCFSAACLQEADPSSIATVPAG